ncbi:MAG: GumC family protein [Candidatus Rokuibacteriota bacterium]
MDLTVLRRIALGVIRRRKRLVMLFAVAGLVVFAPAAYYTSKEPPRYRSAATVLLEARPERVPVFQEYSPSRPLPVQLAILRSRSLAEGVLDTLPKTALQDLIESPYHVDYVGKVMNAYKRFRGYSIEIPNPRRRALGELQQARMRFESRGDGIIEIVAEASRPQIAVEIVATYVDVLLSRTRTFNIDDTRTSREFLEQQLADIKKTARENDDALRGFMNAHGGVAVPERAKTTIAQLSQAEQDLGEVETNRRMIQTRLAALREKFEAQKKQAVPAPAAAPEPKREPAPEVQRHRRLLAQLEGQLLDLRTRFTDEHPRVVLIRSRIAEVQRQLGDAVKETVTPVAAAAVPPAERIDFAQQVVTMETALQTLIAQEEALRKQVVTLRQSLGGLSRSELEYSRLVRDVESQRALHTLFADKLTALRIREQGDMKVVKIIDPPSFPVGVASERRLKFLAAAVMLALVVGAGVPAAVEWLHRTVENEEDVEVLGLPVLAVLPRLRSRHPRFLPADELARRNKLDENLIFSEALRNLRVTIQLIVRSGPVRTLMVSSPMASEGKSTLVVNLGLAFAEAGVRVVLADTDFQRPTLHRVLKVRPGSGLVDALQRDRDVERALVPVNESLWVAPRGEAMRPHTRGMLATNRLNELLGDMAGRADLVLCDSSPVLLIPDNLFLAAAVDGVILVARAGRTTCRELQRAKELLDSIGAKPLGVVINEMPVAKLRNHYKTYYRTYFKAEGT